MGITHLVVNTSEGLRNAKEYRQYELSPQEWARLNEFIRLGLKPIYWKNFQAVYLVKTQLMESQGPYIANPFSFFYSPSYDFIQDMEKKDYQSAEKYSDEILKLFPSEAFWWEKRALLEKEKNDFSKALEDYRRADGLQGLSLEGYKSWFELCQSLKEHSLAAIVLRKAQEAYPR